MARTPRRRAPARRTPSSTPEKLELRRRHVLAWGQCLTMAASLSSRLKLLPPECRAEIATYIESGAVPPPVDVTDAPPPRDRPHTT